MQFTEVKSELERLKKDTLFIKSYPQDNMILDIALKYMTKYSLLLSAIQSLEQERNFIMEKK